MIVSVSRRTDIAAHYGDWFMNRIRDGYFYNVNPFNPKQIKGFSLAPYNVDALVFWTKNPQPMFKHLKTLEQMGYRSLFVYELNAYGETFEPGMPAVAERLRAFARLSDRLGKDKVIWKYAPIILSSQSDLNWHIEQFTNLANVLGRYTKRVMISFLKPTGNPEWQAMVQSGQLETADLTNPQYYEILLDFTKSLKEIASRANLHLEVCCESVDLTPVGIEPGACVSAEYLNRVFGLNLQQQNETEGGEHCLCTQMVDMGLYECCPSLCTYCYANKNSTIVMKNYEAHSPTAPMLYEFRTSEEDSSETGK